MIGRNRAGKSMLPTVEDSFMYRRFAPRICQGPSAYLLTAGRGYRARPNYHRVERGAAPGQRHVLFSVNGEGLCRRHLKLT